MSDNTYTEEEAALAAAHQASEATAELLRFVREGEYSATNAFDGDVIAKLADALKMAIDIQGDRPASRLYADEIELVANLRESVGQFLEGWVE